MSAAPEDIPASFYDFLLDFYRSPDTARKHLHALKKFAPMTPEQTALIAAAIRESGYDATARLLLKVAASGDALLRKGVLANFVNVFLVIFPGRTSEAFLADEHLARLLRRLLRGGEAACEGLSRAQKQHLAICLLALHSIENGFENTLALHERAILPELRAEPVALLKGAFQPCLKPFHERMRARLEEAAARRDEYRDKFEAASASLSRCQAERESLAAANAARAAELERLKSRNCDLEQALMARAIDSANSMSRQQGDFAACLASTARLLENGLAALRSGRAEAARDHIERSHESLELMLQSLREAGSGSLPVSVPIEKGI